MSALGAALLGSIAKWCHIQIPRFFHGTHPPARNKVPGEWTP